MAFPIKLEKDLIVILFGANRLLVGTNNWSVCRLFFTKKGFHSDLSKMGKTSNVFNKWKLFSGLIGTVHFYLGFSTESIYSDSDEWWLARVKESLSIGTFVTFYGI